MHIHYIRERNTYVHLLFCFAILLCCYCVALPFLASHKVIFQAQYMYVDMCLVALLANLLRPSPLSSLVFDLCMC